MNVLLVFNFAVCVSVTDFFLLTKTAHVLPQIIFLKLYKIEFLYPRFNNYYWFSQLIQPAIQFFSFLM
jgi:hypothetical protein